MQILAWIIAGWCGTVIRQIRQPVGPPPSEWPFWDSPHPWREASIGIVGGIAGGLLFNAVAPGDGLPLVNLTVTSFGALLGGNLLSRVVSLFGRTV
jgi:hypothetical protein